MKWECQHPIFGLIRKQRVLRNAYMLYIITVFSQNSDIQIHANKFYKTWSNRSKIENSTNTMLILLCGSFVFLYCIQPINLNCFGSSFFVVTCVMLLIAQFRRLSRWLPIRGLFCPHANEPYHPRQYGAISLFWYLAWPP